MSALAVVNLQLLVSKRFGLADGGSRDAERRREIKRFKAFERLEKAVRASYNAVVFHNDYVKALFNLRNYTFCQRVAAGNFVFCYTYGSANFVRGRNNVGVRNLTNKTVTDECRRVRVQNCGYVRSGLINEFVEGKLYGRFIFTYNRSVRQNLTNIGRR